MDDSTLPTTRQELERKTVEFLESKVHAFEAGELDLDELQLVSKAAWSITAGLVDNSISAMAAEAAGDVKPKIVKRLFLGCGDLAQIAYRPSTDGFAFTRTNAAFLDKKTALSVPTRPGELMAGVARIVNGLLAAGYIEIKL